MKKTLIATIVLAIGLLSVTANAAIVSVSGPSSNQGTPAAIIPAPASVLNSVAYNSGMEGFDEAQGVVTTVAHTVDGSGVIAAGTLVSSHMIFLNKEDGSSGGNILHGPVVWTFDGPVVGVMSDRSGSREAASTFELGAPGTNYPAPFVGRGMISGEVGDSYNVIGNQITVTMHVSQPGDWIRVVTLAPLIQLSALSGLTPAEAYNLVGDEHCVTATVDPAVEGIEVSFDVTGFNPTSGTATTDGNGEATFCYTGDNPGEDTIRAYLDTTPENDSYDEGESTITVTKYWFQDNFLTGGGTIRFAPKGKPDATISGNVGYLPDGTIVGNFNIVDHAGKNHYKCHNDFTSLVFSGTETDSPPASYNTATFIGTFTDKGGVEEDFTIEIVDNDESGGGEDTITVDGFGPIFFSNGNFQVHDGFK